MDKTYGVGWIPGAASYELTEYAITDRGGYICERGVTESHAKSIADKLNEHTEKGMYLAAFIYA